MRKVAVLGIGQTRVDEHWDKTLLELAGDAIFATLNDAGRDRVEGLFVGNMLASQLTKQSHLGALIADWIGFRGIEAFTIETACSSGASAFRMGTMAIASGMMDSVLVVGVEKMTDALPSETTAALATAADADWEVVHGITFVSLNALIMRRYMYEYGWEHGDFAPFSVNAHANGANNPFARFQRPITAEVYKKAGMISAPVNLMDSSPVGDGAAAVLLVPADTLTQRGGRPLVTVEGSASATDSVAIHDRHDPMRLAAAEKSSQKAYAQAGVEPNDIDFFELHDAFSIMSVLSLEACGFAARGHGPRLGLDGAITPKGSIPISTMGGLKARGHPVGATGVYQLVETVQQLRGEAGPAQIEGVKIGMAQNIGGSGATIVTHILKAG